MLHVTGYMLHVTSYRLHLTSYRLHVTSNKLHVPLDKEVGTHEMWNIEQLALPQIRDSNRNKSHTNLLDCWKGPSAACTSVE